MRFVSRDFTVDRAALVLFKFQRGLDGDFDLLNATRETITEGVGLPIFRIVGGTTSIVIDGPANVHGVLGQMVISNRSDGTVLHPTYCEFTVDITESDLLGGQVSIDLNAKKVVVIKVTGRDGRPSARTKFYLLSTARGGSNGLVTDDQREATLLLSPGNYGVAGGPPTPRSIRFEIGEDEAAGRIIEFRLP